MKELLSKTWVKILLIVAIFLGGLLLVGKCEKAKAMYFTLNDGTTSAVRYNEQQKLNYNNNSYMNITKPNSENYVITIEYVMSNSIIYTYYDCLYNQSDNTITCSNLFKSTGTITNEESIFIINSNSVVHNRGTYTEEYIIDTKYEDLYKDFQNAANFAALTELKWNNLLNYLNEKLNFTDEEIGFVLANQYEGSLDVKEEYFMELIETSWKQKVPTEEELMGVIMELTTSFDESLNSLLTSINQKINFTTEEFKNVDLFGMEENSFETPYVKVEYYMNLINQRWDSYLSENGTGGGYTQEQVNELYEQFLQTINIIETSWDNTLKLINEKINFTEDEIIHMLTDENETFQLPQEKEQYYHNLINNRWDSYLNENGTGGSGYTEEELNNKYNQGFNDGKASVDITTDNQAYANKYITDNNYHTNEEYNNLLNDFYDVNDSYINYLLLINGKIAFTNDSDITEHIFTSFEERETYFYNLTTNKFPLYNEEIGQKYVTDNNYQTYQNYVNHGILEYRKGHGEGVVLASNTIATELSKNNINEIKITTYNENGIQIQLVSDFTNVMSGYYSEEELNTKYTEGLNAGYKKANEDGKVLSGFIPTMLGSVVSNAMPFLTYEVFGISLMDVIGIICILGFAIIVIKFLL